MRRCVAPLDDVMLANTRRVSTEDVASGVADEGGVVKDAAKIAAFIGNARAAAKALA